MHTHDTTTIISIIFERGLLLRKNSPAGVGFKKRLLFASTPASLYFRLEDRAHFLCNSWLKEMDTKDVIYGNRQCYILVEKKYTFYPISWRYSLKFNAKEVSIVDALSEGAVSVVLPWVFRYHAINLCTKWYSLHTLYVLLWQDVTNRKPSVCSTVGRSAKYRYLNLLSLF